MEVSHASFKLIMDVSHASIHVPITKASNYSPSNYPLNLNDAYNRFWNIISMRLILLNEHDESIRIKIE
jgi:hypothetical protein